jgi:hypothetical protein
VTCPSAWSFPKEQIAYRLDILDDITILELAFWSILLDEFGDTV